MTRFDIEAFAGAISVESTIEAETRFVTSPSATDMAAAAFPPPEPARPSPTTVARPPASARTLVSPTSVRDDWLIRASVLLSSLAKAIAPARLALEASRAPVRLIAAEPEPSSRMVEFSAVTAVETAFVLASTLAPSIQAEVPSWVDATAALPARAKDGFPPPCDALAAETTAKNGSSVTKSIVPSTTAAATEAAESHPLVVAWTLSESVSMRPGVVPVPRRRSSDRSPELSPI